MTGVGSLYWIYVCVDSVAGWLGPSHEPHDQPVMYSHCVRLGAVGGSDAAPSSPTPDIPWMKCGTHVSCCSLITARPWYSWLNQSKLAIIWSALVCNKIQLLHAKTPLLLVYTYQKCYLAAIAKNMQCDVFHCYFGKCPQQECHGCLWRRMSREYQRAYYISRLPYGTS